MLFMGQDSDVQIVMEYFEFSEWCWMWVQDVIVSIVFFKCGVYEQVFCDFVDLVV